MSAARGAPTDAGRLVVAGAGPAGVAAAVCARRLGLQVALVSPPTAAAPSCPEWIGPAGVALCEEIGLDCQRAGGVGFRGLRLFSWDLRKSAKIDGDDFAGWIVDAGKFRAALRAVARDVGAEAIDGMPTSVALLEDRVEVTLGESQSVRGDVLLIADGFPSRTSRLAGMAATLKPGTAPVCRHAEFSDRSAAGVDVMVGVSRAGQLVTITRDGRQGRITLLTREPDPPPAQQFAEFCQAALRAELIPSAGLESRERESPAGAALDLETHVGKRCLLIGAAGGFVAAFSNEGVYTSMRSGWIAAETVARALSAPVLQDALADFGVDWRGALADYLRMPNTDLSLLMPLAFNNEQMSRRVARAFLLGVAF